MTRYRNARLNEQLKREISEILARKVRDPRVGRVLVTEVRITADLWMARVYVRVLDESPDMEETLEGLAAAAPFIRTELAKVLHIRRTPELRFLHDTTLDSALRIEEVLREVLPPDDGGEGEGEGGSDAPGQRGEGGETPPPPGPGNREEHPAEPPDPEGEA
jgi:ribosome-binding factor A